MSYAACIWFTRRTAARPRGLDGPCSTASASSSAVSSYRFCVEVVNSPVSCSSRPMLGTA